MFLDKSYNVTNAELLCLSLQIAGENKWSLLPWAGTVLTVCLCPLDVAIVENVVRKQQLKPEPALK